MTDLKPVLKFKMRWGDTAAMSLMCAAVVAFITVSLWMVSESMIERSRANYIEPTDSACVVADQETTRVECGTVIFKGEEVYRP